MLRAFGILAIALSAAGCSGELVADIAVKQGREAYAADAGAIEAGMSASEVRTLLGPPHSRWELDGEVWVYFFKHSSQNREEQGILRIAMDSGKVAGVETEGFAQ